MKNKIKKALKYTLLTWLLCGTISEFFQRKIYESDGCNVWGKYGIRTLVGCSPREWYYVVDQKKYHMERRDTWPTHIKILAFNYETNNTLFLPIHVVSLFPQFIKIIGSLF